MKGNEIALVQTKETTSSVTISFQNLSYQVKVKNPQGIIENKMILNNISGICKPAQVTAILGASGAGKTSLLNILAKRISPGGNVALQGNIHANGEPYNSDKFSQFSSYVMQNDVLFGTLTVRETLEFVANLKYADPKQKIEKVEYALKTLKLEKCQNTLIGNALIKGISGGERKRTSIGVELVSDPFCILLDEPTSGLDSFTAFIIINLLRKLAHSSGRTIVFTIHQPSADIYMLFDQVMLLVQGKFIYQGSRVELVNYFKGIGFECPAHSNPLDYLMSVMHHEDADHPHYQTLFNGYNQRFSQEIENAINSIQVQQISRQSIQTSFGFQVAEIFRRGMINVKRDKVSSKRSFRGIFWTAGSEPGYKGIQSTIGVLFFLVMSSFMGALNPVMVQFPAEREVFLREENSKLYSTAAYFTGKSSVELPFLFVFPIIQQLICYWMTQLQLTLLFVSYLVQVEIVLVQFNFQLLGLMTGCMFNDLKAAAGFLPVVLMPLVIFSGFYANQSMYMDWIGWIQYLSPMKYAFEALVWNEFETRRDEFIGQTIENSNPIDTYNLDLGLWKCLVILAAIILFFRFMALMFLYLLRGKQQ
ncbi:unnamed protein product (macronuclear) [Paramecium tetraurelia]|uniref:ABC transporter domain-containing protein n=1 Tax=Paramecium tetraurelia TaxID=5888 RepID=A0DNP8_PARTE|nr:uncharacterized protein GSPATT00018861001 [Paramecium tetraurelia]CAK84665.1 unnamed protein product [Paramecium tetraurelia]|eukprot:XP_001452062.1 hypothetical protein (macronuclear) [Paramecium tetraurelia strain d4-2]